MLNRLLIVNTEAPVLATAFSHDRCFCCLVEKYSYFFDLLNFILAKTGIVMILIKKMKYI